MKKFLHYLHSHFKFRLIFLFFISGFLPVVMLFTTVFHSWYHSVKTKEISYINEKILTINSSMDELYSLISRNLVHIISNKTITTILSTRQSNILVESFKKVTIVEDILRSISNYSEDGFSYTLIDRNSHIYTNGSAINIFEKFNGPLCTQIKESHANIFVTERKLYSTDENKIYTFGRTIIRDGQVIGIIIVDISSSTFDNLLSSFNDEHYTIAIANEDYEIIYSNSEQAPDLLNSAISRPDTAAPYVTYKNANYLFTTKQASFAQCNTFVFVPEAYIFMDSKQLLIKTLCILFFILIQTIVFSNLISNSLYRYIFQLKEELSRFMRTKKKIELSYRSQDEIKEIADGILYLENEIMAMITKIQEEEGKKRLLELRALQFQIRPHMIYNTLNTILHLAQLQGIKNIEEVTTSFANMLKIISKVEGDFLSLKQELDFINNFIIIKKYNLYQIFSLTINADPSLLNIPILKLLLQPFIENAIIHGFQGISYAGMITLEIALEDNDIHISITDNGIGMNPDAIDRVYQKREHNHTKYASTGISNSIERLKLQYGESCSFAITSDAKSYTTVFLTYPVDDTTI